MLFKQFIENKSDETKQQSLNDKAYKDVNADWDPPSKKQQPLKEEDMEAYKTKSIIDGLEEFLNVQVKYQEDKTCIKVEDLKKVFAEYRKHMKV